jgi:septal ring factor EnvC (AmiA/AmiB activator)
MTDLPEMLRTLVAIQKQLATLDQRIADVQDDQKAMREQVDVIKARLAAIDKQLYVPPALVAALMEKRLD